MIWEFSHYGSESSVAWKTASGEGVIIKGPPTAPDIFHVLTAQQEQNVKYTVGQKDGGGVLLDKERFTIGQKIHKQENKMVYYTN